MFRTALLGIGSAAIAALASAQTFTPYASFPVPATGSYYVVGGALTDGRLMLWNGAALYLQSHINTDDFHPVATGYRGDPAFFALTPDKQTAYLGAGFDNTFSPDLGTNGEIYRIDPNNLADYSAATVVANQSAFAGAMLSDSLLIIDAGRSDFSGSDLLILDVSGAKSRGSVPVVHKPDWPARSKNVVLPKPGFAYSASITVDFANNFVYAMDGNTRELRRFDRNALIAAFQGNTTLDWTTDGTLIGSPGTYFTGGVAAINPGGDLLIPGSAGFGQPGGIQIVDPGTGTILSTLDPSGTQEFVSIIYNDVLDVITAFASNTQEAFVGLPTLASVPAVTGWSLGLLGTALVCCAIGRSRRH